MKIFISADIEGISGLATKQQITKDSEYQRFRRIMTEEVNSAIRGAFNGGATEVVVADGHGNMSNIIIEELDPRAYLVSGSNRVMCQLECLDETFDGIIFIGHHGRESASNAVISHTLAGLCVKEMTINNKVVGETEMNAMVAGGFDVPAIFISGDDLYVQEVKNTLPNIESVIVKYARNRFSAMLINPKLVYKKIESGVKNAIMNIDSYKPLKTNGRITFELEFKGPEQAQMTTTLPTVNLLTPTRIAFTSENIISAYKHMWACVIIGISATEGILGHVNP